MNKNIISLLLVLSFSAAQAKSLVEERFEKTWSKYCGKETEKNTLLGSAKERYLNYLFGCKADIERDFCQKGDALRGEEGATAQKMMEITKELAGPELENHYRFIDQVVSAHLGVGVDQVKQLPVRKKAKLFSMLCSRDVRICRMSILGAISLLKKSNSYDDQEVEKLLKQEEEQTVDKLKLYRFNQSVLWKVKELLGY
jgi:hypothetical protein